MTAAKNKTTKSKKKAARNIEIDFSSDSNDIDINYDDSSDSHNEEEAESSCKYCNCMDVQQNAELWMGCMLCERWFHKKCVHDK